MLPSILPDGSLSVETTLTIQPLNNAQNEGNTGWTQFLFLVQRTGDLTQTTEVDWNATGSGPQPADAVDFGGQLPAGRLRFEAGESQQEIIVAVLAEQTVEEDENFWLALSNPTPGTILGASQAVGAIVNDDTSLAITTLTPSQPEGNEDATSFHFQVTRAGFDRQSLTVDWTAEGGVAAPADIFDFGGVFPEGSLTFAEEETLKEIVINVAGDTEPEGDETFQVQLANPSQAVALTPDTALATIENDDPVPLILPLSPVGVNLSGVHSFSSAVPFIDAFQSARPWIPQKKSTRVTATLDLDEQGWVKSLPSPGGAYDRVTTTLYDNLQGNYLGGEYVVLYDGEGSLTYQNDAVKNTGASTPGRDVITLTPSNRGFRISLTATNPENYLRNIRVIPLAAEGSYEQSPFNPDYLAKIDAFSAFRFMDWMATNNSSQREWSDRPTLEKATWVDDKGVPVEILVQIANTTGANPWFTLPHQATDDYVRNFAQYVRDNLDPDLTVYVEYSNEVWNGLFKQNQWVKQQALLEWTDPSVSDADKIMDWYSRRTTQVTQIWDQVFGAEKERVIGVMSGQATSVRRLNRALSYAWAETPLTHQEYGIDSLAIAPYFGRYLGLRRNQAQLKTWLNEPDGGLNTLFTELTEGGQLSGGPSGGGLAQAEENIDRHKNLAQEQGLSLLAYEGGQFLINETGNNAISQLFNQANRDPRMGQLYERYLEIWNEAGGGLLAHFNDISRSSSFGSYGLLEFVNASGSAKYNAVTDYLAEAAAIPPLIPTTFLSLAPLDADRPEGNEGVTNFTFLATRSGDVSAATEVAWTVTGVGANGAHGEDFGGALPQGVLTFAPGETTQMISVSVLGDSLSEADEFFRVSFAQAPLGTEIQGGQALGSIRNDDLVLAIAPVNLTQPEGNSGLIPFTFTVTRSGAGVDSLTVNWHVLGVGEFSADPEDFGGAFPSGTVSFAPGETSQILTIYSAGDLQVENDETFKIFLTQPGTEAPLASATATMVNDDLVDDLALVLTPLNATQPEGNSDLTPFTFTLARVGALDVSAELDWTVVGAGANPTDAEDFGGAFPSGTVSFAPGETTQIITVNVRGDRVIEVDEAFSLVLSNPQNGAVLPFPAVLGTIQNDDSNASAFSPVGMNLSGLRSFSSALPFLDSFKLARPWLPQKGNIFDTGHTLNLDQNGWVTSLPADDALYDRATTIIHDNINGNYPGGRYVVRYEGEGTLIYRKDARYNKALSSPGRHVIDVDPSNEGIHISLTATNPENYLRNIEVVPLAQENNLSSFNPDYLAKIDPFSTLRFMEWMATNNSPQRDWSDRPTLDKASWVDAKGAPVEILVELANTTDANPWFTLPHQATDDYVRNFAQYVRDNLDPGLTVYVEYSNEVWNGLFEQNRWVKEQALLEWPDTGVSAADKITDWYSRRTTQITQIWDEVFGADKDRVMGVMAGRAANKNTLERALSYAWAENPLSHQEYGIDAIAIAPYFGRYIGASDNQSQLNAWLHDPDGGLDRLFTEITEGNVLRDAPRGGALAAAGRQILNHSTLANAQGLTLLAYEGGQSLINATALSPVTQLFAQANQDPRMGAVYEQYLTLWNSLGGDLMVHFNDIGRNFGALEFLTDTGSPKYDALINYINQSA
ncbi:MAG: Calx-beta domain-containing protein [Cyanobacteriota bacterium]|jgi:hypothetical protein